MEASLYEPNCPVFHTEASIIGMSPIRFVSKTTWPHCLSVHEKENFLVNIMMRSTSSSGKGVAGHSITILLCWWTFIKPDGISEDQFEKQLANFDSEISKEVQREMGNSTST